MFGINYRCKKFKSLKYLKRFGIKKKEIQNLEKI